MKLLPPPPPIPSHVLFEEEQYAGTSVQEKEEGRRRCIRWMIGLLVIPLTLGPLLGIASALRWRTPKSHRSASPDENAAGQFTSTNNGDSQPPSTEPSAQSIATAVPTLMPLSRSPADRPSPHPHTTSQPTRPLAPTKSPTLKPTKHPTLYPTDMPSPWPVTSSPTRKPSQFPTNRPTESPVTARPTINAKECAQQLEMAFPANQANLTHMMAVAEQAAVIGNWCPENPLNIAKCSCRNPAKFGAGWQWYHNSYVETVQNATDDYDIIFYGDSITNGWTVKDDDREPLWGEWPGLIFEDLFPKGVSMGIGGDRLPFLMWRLLNGEAPPSLEPRVFWILIGTNDMRGGCIPEIIITGILTSVEILRLHPRLNTKIVINGILPRGEEDLWGGSNEWTESIWNVNHHLECYAAQHENVEFFNGTKYFLDETETRINGTLMGDFLHPSNFGYRTWGDGIAEFLRNMGVRR